MSISPRYIPFGRPNFSQAEMDAVTNTMKNGWIGMGPETIAFEKELTQYLGAAQVVTLNSCTSALHLALQTAGIKENDEVIVPALTWCSTANAALYLGAKPVFCDVDPQTMCLTPELVAEKLTPKTRAVMVVHYGGYAADVDALRKVLPPTVQIIEDAAHAFGAKFPSGKRVGASGNATCFSFYANKNLSTGDGGALALADEEKANHARSLRQHALPVDAWMRFTHAKNILLSNHLTELGYKMNYTDLHASIGRVQLKRFDELQFIRKSIATIYVEKLSKLFPDMVFQTDILSDSHARHLFVIQLPESLKMTREEIILALRSRNVGATIHYTPLHVMPLYHETENAVPNLPIIDGIHKRLLTLPISSSMSETETLYVVDQLKQVLK